MGKAVQLIRILAADITVHSGAEGDHILDLQKLLHVSGITGITKVTCLATTPPTSGEYFTNEVYQNATLYVPMNSVELYRAAAGWCNFQNIVGIDTGDEPVMRGDVDGNKVVDINDVTLLIDVTLGMDVEFVAEGADCESESGDGVIDINDVTSLIQFVLSGTW